MIFTVKINLLGGGRREGWLLWKISHAEWLNKNLCQINFQHLTANLHLRSQNKKFSNKEPSLSLTLCIIQVSFYLQHLLLTWPFHLYPLTLSFLNTSQTLERSLMMRIKSKWWLKWRFGGFSVDNCPTLPQKTWISFRIQSNSPSKCEMEEISPGYWEYIHPLENSCPQNAWG